VSWRRYVLAICACVDYRAELRAGRSADPDQVSLTGAPESPVGMGSPLEDKVRLFLDLFRCRSDVYVLRWKNRRHGRSG
jgi:hypothetical protein